VRQVLGIGPGLPHEPAWRVEASCDDKLSLVGVVTCNVSVFFIGDLLVCGVGAVFLLGLQLFQQSIEALAVALPELAIAFQPSAGFRERLGFQPSRPSLGVAAARDQARAFQYLQCLEIAG